MGLAYANCHRIPSRLLFAMASLAVGSVGSAGDLRIGLIGLDTSHTISIAQLLNDPSNPQHVHGARVIAAYPGGSPDIEDSRTRLAGFTSELRSNYHVEIVQSIEELVSMVDAIMLESVDGRAHLSQVRPVFAVKKRIFIDKPLASTYSDAKEIARLGRLHGVPWFSASDLRYFDQMKRWRTEPILSAYVWGPGQIEPHQQIELAWYGIHSVELLYSLMGPGCEKVSRLFRPDADLVTGIWKDGRIGVVHLSRNMASSVQFGAVVRTPSQVLESRPSDGDFYPELMEEVIRFFQTGIVPVDNKETLEMFAFMDAAQRSKESRGAYVKLPQ